MELCIRLVFKLFLITAIRHVYESCDDYSMCEKNSECKEINQRRTCQCQQGYGFIYRRCIKGIHFCLCIFHQG